MTSCKEIALLVFHASWAHYRHSYAIAGLENKVCAKAGSGGGKASVTAAPSSSKKSTRKDKGKPRFTAYMLWAKANRDKVTKEINAAQGHQQTIDFNAVTKRLVSQTFR